MHMGVGTPVQHQPTRPGASSAASNPGHLCTLIATSLWMLFAYPWGVTALAQQSCEVLEFRLFSSHGHG